MADVNANIGINIDASDALSQLKSLQRQISQFHTSIAKSSEAAALAQRSLQKNLLNSINSLSGFSAEMRTVRTTAESFTNSLEKNKLSLREYFRYAGASTKTFGRLFTAEFDTISKTAEDRVKKMQTQYIKMGRDASGAMRAIAVIPEKLNLDDHSTRLQLAAQRQQIFNQLVKQGSTNLLNFGKNTQWAGRQLMVGFTIPLATLGSTASKVFMDMETAAIKFRKVYGDLFTPKAETQAALDNITELGRAYTKYGIAVSKTVSLAAEAAAAGFQGLDLQRQTEQATRLSILGQIDQQKALETTISLQNAFRMSSEDLASSIDFLNAVENQTVTSLDDVTTAIPKAAPVIQQLGGDVKDLAFLLTAMREGGINASEGANALKSGLASIINPTAKASEMLMGMGINIDKIVQSNRGNLKATVIEFATAMNQLDPLSRARAIEQLFGKFQFARISTLLQNVTQTGNQASRVLDLAGASVQDLASLSSQELGITAESAMNKFKGAVEDLRFALIPLGETFLTVITPVIDGITGILEKFNNLSDGTKKVIAGIALVLGGIGPIALMTFGLLANGLANIIKAGLFLRNTFLKLTGQSKMLGDTTQYLTDEQLQAEAAASSLDQAHARLTQRFTVESGAVRELRDAYLSAIAASERFALANPGMMIPGFRNRPRGFADGGIIKGPGTGKSDSIFARLSNGEAVIPADSVARYPQIVNALVSGNIPGFNDGVEQVDTTPVISTPRARQTPIAPSDIPAVQASHFADLTPANLINTISSLSDGLDQLQFDLYEVKEAADGAGFTFERTTQTLSDFTNDPNTKLMLGGEVFGGTTTATVADRNQMFQKVRVAGEQLYSGEPFTLKQVIEAADRAEIALRDVATASGPYAEELRGLVEEGRVARGLVNSDNATQHELNFMKQNAEKSMIEAMTNDVRGNLNEQGKKRSLAETRTVVQQKLLAIDNELLELQQQNLSSEELLKRAKDKYYTEMLKSGTGQAVVTTSTASRITDAQRDIASGRVGRGQGSGTSRPRSVINSIDNARIYRGRPLKKVAHLVITDMVNLGQQTLQNALSSFSRAARRALRMNSPSIEMSNAGQQAGESLVAGARSQIDDAKVAGEQIGNSVVSSAQRTSQLREKYGPVPEGMAPGQYYRSLRQERLASSAQASSGGFSQAEKEYIAQAKVISDSNRRFKGFSMNMQSASMAMSGLSGILMMGSRNSESALAKFVDKVFMASMALSSLSMLPLGGIGRGIAGRFGRATQGVRLASRIGRLGGTAAAPLTTAIGVNKGVFKTIGSAGRQAGLANLGSKLPSVLGKVVPMFGRLALGIGRFLGPWGLLASTIGSVYMLWRRHKNSQEEARKKIEGLGEAARLSKDQIKGLGDFFGVTPIAGRFARGREAKAGAAGEALVPAGERSKVQELKQDETFKKNFADQIKTLKYATDRQASVVLNSIAQQLYSSGFSTEMVRSIITAIQEESGQTDVVIDFKSIDLSQKGGLKQLKTSVDKMIKEFSYGFKKGGNELKKATGLISAAMTNTIEAVSNQFEQGKISAEQFNKAFSSITQSILAMPEPQALIVMNSLMQNLPEELRAAASGVKDIGTQMMFLKAQALGMDTALIKAAVAAQLFLENPEGREGGLGAAQATQSLQKFFDDVNARAAIIEKAMAAFTAGNKEIPDGGGTGDKELSALQKAVIKRYEQEVKALQKKRDALKEVNEETKRQYELDQKQNALAQQIADAKISGNYIQVALLKQEQAFNQSEYDRETKELELEKRISEIENRIQAINNGARVTAAEAALANIGAKGKDKTTLNPPPPPPSPKPGPVAGPTKYWENYGKKQKELWKNKGITPTPVAGTKTNPSPAVVPQVKQNGSGTSLPKYSALSPGLKEGAKFTLEPSGITYTLKKQGANWMWVPDSGAPLQSVSATFANGGIIKGPGTRKSDSIAAFVSSTPGFKDGALPIRVSAGEYIVNAASTSMHKGVLDSINNGTYNPNPSSTVYNSYSIDVSGVQDPKMAADLVMRKLQLIENKSNTSNKVESGRGAWS